MELILTSFGASHLPPRRVQNAGVFYRMPPVSMSDITRGFIPEYAVLLLCERVILDAESWSRLSKGKYDPDYGEVANAFKELYDEGFIKVEDFDSIIDENSNLLERMLEKDLKRLDEWVSPLKESVETWRDFIGSLSEYWREMRGGHLRIWTMPQGRDVDNSANYHHIAGCLHDAKNTGAHALNNFHLLEEAMKSATKRRRAEYRRVLRNTLTEYLAYVNANLILSQTLQAGFHDWYDFAPFYREKFLTVGKEKTEEQKRIDKVKQLFEISFPEFVYWDAKGLIKALKDKRIVELRTLVEKAARGEVTFDRDFANRVLQEVIGIEQRVSRLRSIISYVTLPIGFVPWIGTPAQKATEEIISHLAEAKAKKEFRWFYLISKFGRNRQCSN